MKKEKEPSILGRLGFGGKEAGGDIERGEKGTQEEKSGLLSMFSSSSSAAPSTSDPFAGLTSNECCNLSR